MIRKNFNAISSGCSGIFARQVMQRIRRGQEEVCKVPVRRPGPGTPRQAEARKRFADANEYYRKVRRQPALNALYERSKTQRLSVQNLCVGDYFHAPEILEVDTSTYTGMPGNRVLIRATDDFCVKSVKVSVYDAEGVMVEEGEAFQLGDAEYWEFTASCMNIGGGYFIVSASDWPGNITSIEVPLAAAVAEVFAAPAEDVPPVRMKRAAYRSNAVRNAPGRRRDRDWQPLIVRRE
ncbi:hypothetical protein MKQ68_03075 [Chitinophaga horti]|uniref:Uncharacterized protein n=1 Tax=Chitinophaga horti TaxID=2920382 RepID=A0ABY6J655_9BACT|nr:hypothetical protein [Chitinophaga horti]UYQ94072.1 hypothetical protein MKQ68_03075 [Chitinophaga horti]